MLQDNYTSIQEIPLLTEAEQHQLLIQWNDTKVQYLDNKVIYQLFEEQVEKTPNNIAVAYEDKRLTYKQLNERANQLAHYLRTLGVKPDVLVALSMDRSLEMIIGILGILKAGGAYVPLDPNYPKERLQFILEDTQAPILLIQSHLKTNFETYSGIIFKIDDDLDIINQESNINLDCLTSSHHLAYVIYTSGSTGKPKGVMVEQRNLIESTKARLKYYPTSPHNFLLLSSISFDSSIAGIFWSLISGGTIVLPENVKNIDVNNILDHIQKYQISHLLCVPSFYKTLLEHQKDCYNIHPLSTVIVAGEKFDDLLINQHKEHLALSSLFNEYGPTETCIWSSVTNLYNARTQYSNKLTIGHPIANVQMYILDGHMNPVPIGVAGEIYIGGVGLARGYLKRPDLTAVRFIPNPFVSDADDNEPLNLRLYRTGDVARYLQDGNIEFLGRIDDQVKIRGFRIELGEIESTLNSHHQVVQAIVLAREDESNDKKLIAYVVPTDNIVNSLSAQSTLSSSAGESFSILSGDNIPVLTEDLRNHIIRLLPDHMNPSFFVYLNRMPLTINGKIDRKTLPAPDLSFRQVGNEYVPAHSPLEQELSRIWTDILKIKEIGIYDNFFKLGGHSLLATQVISRIRHTCMVDIPLRALF